MCQMEKHEWGDVFITDAAALFHFRKMNPMQAEKILNK